MKKENLEALIALIVAFILCALLENHI